jgi:hypothetical protein
MAIESRWLAMGRPSGVCNAAVGVKSLCQVDARLCNQLSELGHLAHLFECKHLILLVSIDSKAGRVVTSIFEAGE